LAGGILGLFAVGHEWSTGYFVSFIIVTALVALAASGAPDAGGKVAALTGVGAVIGAIVSCTSSNGVHNFGVGAAGVMPFLFLYGARAVASIPASRLAGAALPALAGLLLWNGLLNPYAEQDFKEDFHRIEGVPAFRGIWTSKEKIEAITRFQALIAPVDLRGRRVLVIGPHPWLYFVTKGEPATPMFWMLFIGAPESYEVVAARLFRPGPPDAILLTENTLPPPIGAKMHEWMETPFAAERTTLPPHFILRFGRQAGVLFPPEVFLLSRSATAPASPASQ
jgi:hypothetical protein